MERNCISIVQGSQEKVRPPGHMATEAGDHSYGSGVGGVNYDFLRQMGQHTLHFIISKK